MLKFEISKKNIVSKDNNFPFLCFLTRNLFKQLKVYL